MTKSDEQLIQKYLDNQLSENDLSNFELRMKQDPAFQQEMESLQAIDLALESVGVDSFRNQMQGWETELNQPRKIIPLRRILSIAAAVIILVTASILIFRPPEYSNQDLYAEYYAPYPNLISARDDIVVPDLERGMEAYTAENYSEAINYLSGYVSEGGDEKGAKLYLGIALMQSDAGELASEHLSDLISDPLYSQQAKWYLGLLRLKENNLGKASEIFEQIAQDNTHYRQQDAKEILQKSTQ